MSSRTPLTAPDVIRLSARHRGGATHPAELHPSPAIDLRDSGHSHPSRLRRSATRPTGPSAPTGPWIVLRGPATDVQIRTSASSRLLIRLFDVAVSSVALTALAPLLVLVAAAVKLNSRGPVFYGSPRYGRGGTMFTAWKFRSMKTGAADDLQRLMAADPTIRAEYTIYHKLRSDPRLTGVGALLRRTSIDEVPQLLNILRGEMSVVGPRPNIEADARAFGSSLAVVLQVKPGLTGLWQISGRNRLPIYERVAIEVDYVQSRTLPGDLRICGVTFLQLWRPGKYGAY